MQKSSVRWILAVIITLSAAVYQRMTGPTYPLRGNAVIEDHVISYKFLRSYVSDEDQPVSLLLPDTSFKASVLYRRFNTDSDYSKIEMQRSGDSLRAFLPKQPPAGKLEYFVELRYTDKKFSLPAERTVVTRYKGAVPGTALIPHVILMFIAMLFSNVSLFEAIANGPKVKSYAVITAVLLFLGGMVLGPVVQKYAFGAFWTGVPFGWDLTDNKTLLAMIGWTAGVIAVFSGEIKKRRWWVAAAAIILLLVYLIPHSTMGSELDYSKMEVTTGGLE